MVRVVTYQGIESVAGLSWRPKAQRQFWQSPPVAADWADRSATIPDGERLIGKASLLSLLVGSVFENALRGTVLFAYSDESQSAYFAVVVVGGKPALGTEQLFQSEAELKEFLTRECSSGQIERLATTADLAAEVHTHIEVVEFDVPSEDFEPVRIDGKVRKQNQNRGLIIGSVVVGGLALFAGAGWFWLSHQKPKDEDIPKIAMIVDRTTFSESCLEAFNDEWPLSPGWELTQEGCATREMKDPALLGFSGADAVAYREYQLRRGYNQSVARKAAEAVYDETAVDLRVEGTRLFATKTIRAPLTEVGQGELNQPSAPTAGELLKMAEAVFLGSAEKVELPGGAGSRIRIELKGSFQDALNRGARLKKIDIARLTRKGSVVTLEVTPQKPRLVPVTSVQGKS
jgi:hypothetical protein